MRNAEGGKERTAQGAWLTAHGKTEWVEGKTE